MSKWSLLKAALVCKERDSRSAQSIHRFSGYHCIAKNKIIWPGFLLEFQVPKSIDNIIQQCHQFLLLMDSSECRVLLRFSPGISTEDTDKFINDLLKNPLVRLSSTGDNYVEVYVKNDNYLCNLQQCEYWQYDLPSGIVADMPRLFTREKSRTSGLSVQSLLSNKLHGVDNTGNVCVWPAEPLLLHVLLTVQRYRDMVLDKNVLELGGGMTALAGLGIAITGLASTMVVTDGHPDCVQNQNVCIEMTRQQPTLFSNTVTNNTNCSIIGTSTLNNVSANLLHWSPTTNASQIADLTQGGTKLFDAVIASDCLFFRDFHEGLLQTLRCLLRPKTGVGIFLQPARDGTMSLFAERCAQSGLFSVEVLEDYCPQVLVHPLLHAIK